MKEFRQCSVMLVEMMEYRERCGEDVVEVLFDRSLTVPAPPPLIPNV